jgi:hypothetical protein
MGFLTWLTGTSRPRPGTRPRSPDEVRAALLAVNRPSAPFLVRAGEANEPELVSEWRIVDARWYEVFAAAELQKAAKILMRLDVARREVRAVDQEWSVEWRAGVPQLSLSASAFRGQTATVEIGRGYAFTESLRPGEVYNYRFVSKEMKDPLRQAVLGAGWGWRGVAFGKL